MAGRDKKSTKHKNSNNRKPKNKREETTMIATEVNEPKIVIKTEEKETQTDAMTKSETAMDPLPEVLLHEIECLICLQYMTPPIKMCLNGHNICKDCRHNIEKCPVCRDELIDTRNLTAESMSRLITHPCVNKKFGCTGHFLLDFKEEHEKTCLFRPIDCPFCQKEGSRLEIQEHFKNDHLVFQEKAEDGKYKKSYSHDPEVKKYKAVHEFGEVFFAVMLKNVCDLEYIGHFYLGEEDEARKFGYKITLTSQDGKETMSSYRLCRSYLSLNKVTGTGNKKYNEYFSTFPKCFVDECFDSNNELTYDFEILQASTGN